MVGSTRDGINDYLERVDRQIKDREYVVSTHIDAGPKPGTASAHIRSDSGAIMVDHGGRRLTINLKAPEKVSEAKGAVKTIWRTPIPRWPCLEDKDPKDKRSKS